jgi:uncharacterized membrane protein YphA (DoxX/SURF4 family)
MGNSAVRILALGLGILLLFHGIHTIIYGTEFIKELILDFYAPYLQNKPCGICIGGMMIGESFMQTMLTGSSTDYTKYIAYASYGVYLAEVIAPLFLITGYYIKIAASVIAIDISLAILLEYHDKVFTLTESGAWSLELPMLYLIGVLTLILNQKPRPTKRFLFQ